MTLDLKPCAKSIAEAAIHLHDISDVWSLVDNGTKLYASYKFSNFKKALAFVNQVSNFAEEHKHHPDIEFGWGYVHIHLQTHEAGGVTDKDFALVDDIDKIEL